MAQSLLLTDLREFIALHYVHGELRAKASAPTPTGYRLQVVCPCGVEFERWVFPYDAANVARTVELEIDRVFLRN